MHWHDCLRVGAVALGTLLAFDLFIEVAWARRMHDVKRRQWELDVVVDRLATGHEEVCRKLQDLEARVAWATARMHDTDEEGRADAMLL